MLTRQEFYSKGKIQNLPLSEKRRRWQQYLATRQALSPARRNFSVTQVPTSANAGDAVATVFHHFPPCAIHYLQALEHPFGLTSAPCIPDLHSVPSKKIKCLTRFNFSTGTTGFGYCVGSPWCNANDGWVALSTTSTYAGSNAVQIAAFAGTTTQTSPKLPYPTTVFESTTKSPGVQARTVGYGLRVRYIGAELARSGQIIAMRHPDNETLVGLTSDEIKTYAETRTYPVTREWTYVHYRPVRPTEYEFSPDPCTASNSTNYRWNLGALITGTTTSSGTPGPAPFEAEIIQFVEYIGNVDNITRSHTDVTAMSHIRNHLRLDSATQNPVSNLLTSVTKIGSKMIKHGAPNLVESVMKSGTKGILKSAGEAITKLLPGKFGSFNPISALEDGASSVLKGLFSKSPLALGRSLMSGAAEMLPEMLPMLL